MAKYSIIIPTRERHQTLEYSVRSALSIARDDIEVIVSDNFSSIETQNLIETIHDKRLIYSRTSQRLSMTENFERGIQQATGDYITIIGDDDCVIPSIFDSIIEQLSAGNDVVYWFRYPYFWNNSSEQPGLLYGSVSSYFHSLPSHDLLKQVLANFLNYQFLPSFYNSWISRSVIQKIVDFNQSSSLCLSIYPKNVISPDVYSALLVLLFTDSITYSGIPFSLSGISSFSNGIGMATKNRDSQLFVQEQNSKSPEELCHRMIRPLFEHLEPNSKYLILLFIASDYLLFLENYKSLIQTQESQLVGSVFRELCKNLNLSFKEADKLANNLNFVTSDIVSTVFNKKEIKQDYLHEIYGVPKPKRFVVDSRKCGVSNCLEAMQLYEKILTDKKLYRQAMYASLSIKLKKIAKRIFSND